uniref:NACHT LRR and PYD domain-containing protein n=1 Tax=Xiphophorus couchianus TaxID=32473 RepID=A0A3B5L6B3_9TELE
ANITYIITQLSRLIWREKLCRFFSNYRFARCELSETHCEVVASSLRANPSHLTELDLSCNKLGDYGVKLLCDGLESSNCKLEILRSVLWGCSLSEHSCALLGSALKSSQLTELDLSQNKDLGNAGANDLFGFLKSPLCKLRILKLRNCRLSEISCSSLASALKSNPSHLTELDLSDNKDLKDAGVKELCGFLQMSVCKLQTLKLKDCSLSEISCAALASALKSNPSHLRELDLSLNDCNDAGVKELCGFLLTPLCKLHTLRLGGCKLKQAEFEVVASALKSSQHLTELEISQIHIDGTSTDSGLNHVCEILESSVSKVKSLSLSEVSCSSLVSALKSNPSHLTQLDLRGNNLKDSGVKEICGFLQNPEYTNHTCTEKVKDQIGDKRLIKL